NCSYVFNLSYYFIFVPFSILIFLYSKPFSFNPQIATEATGGFWNESTSSARNYQPLRNVSDACLLDMENRAAVGGSNRLPRSSASGSDLFSGSSADLERWLDSSNQKTHTEEFFQSKVRENLTRPDNIPPSEGGKYMGFGSKPIADFRDQDVSTYDSAVKALSSSFSVMSRLASVAAKKTGELASSASQKTRQISSSVHEKVGPAILQHRHLL
ncbi:unnamed protein product, partial [Protopolystoma xenopodis]